MGSAIALANRGHRVTILSTAIEGDEEVVRRTWPALDESGVELAFVPAGAGMMPGKARRLIFERLVRAADAVHIHTVWDPLLLALGRIAYAHRVPYFVSVHGVFDRRAMKRIKTKYVKKRIAMHVLRIRSFLDRAAGVVFGSEAEAAESWIPSRRMRSIFVPNGAPAGLGLAEPTTADFARLAEIAPAQPTWTRTLLCRSRLHPEKGVDLLIEAFDRVAPEFPGVGLLIAGLQQDSTYQAQIHRAVADSEVANRMVLTTELTGPSSQFLYRACDLFVMPSLAEGFSMALIEGLANARPLLITRYCHMPQVAQAGAGLVVEPLVVAIADGLRRLLAADDTQWAEMGKAARALFADRFTWDHVAAELERHYSDAAAT